MLLNPSRKPKSRKPELEVISECSLLEIDTWEDRDCHVLDYDLVPELKNNENVHRSLTGRLPTIDEDDENVYETQSWCSEVNKTQSRCSEVNKTQSRCSEGKGSQTFRKAVAVGLPALRLTGERLYIHHRQPSVSATPCRSLAQPINTQGHNRRYENTPKTSRLIPSFTPLPMRTHTRTKNNDTTSHTNIQTHPRNTHKKSTINTSHRLGVTFPSLEKTQKTSTKVAENKLHVSGQQISLHPRHLRASRKPTSRS